MQDIQKLHDILTELTAIFEELFELESVKIDAIAANDIPKLDNCMKDEQVISMRLRGLDAKREKVQAELRMPGLTFKEIIERAEGEEKETLSEAYIQLEGRLACVKEATECSKKYIELHLKSLDFLLTQLDHVKNNPDSQASPEKKHEEKV